MSTGRLSFSPGETDNRRENVSPTMIDDDDAARTALAATTAAGRPVESHLDEGESVEFVLVGTVLDVVRGEEASRTMAAESGGLTTLVTDGRILFVVERREHADVTAVDRESVVGARVETMGDAVRLAVETDEGPDYVCYPDDADEADVRRVADALGREDGREDGSDEADPMDRLERLADLHERGALTDEEFESKKRDLLDRI